MYTMNALEKALQTNSTPLLLFAALKDFSGENINFLNHIREWKASWNPPSNRFTALNKTQPRKLEGEVLRRHQFGTAVQIYASCVGVQYSDFPINLSFAHRKELEFLFDDAASFISAHINDNSATPFDDLEGGLEHDGMSLASTSLNRSTEEIIAQPGARSMKRRVSVGLICLEPSLPTDIAIPVAFGPHAFDNAEDSIKYMVLTNTWPKFVSAGYVNSAEPQTLLCRVKKVVPPWIGELWHP